MAYLAFQVRRFGESFDGLAQALEEGAEAERWERIRQVDCEHLEEGREDWPELRPAVR